MKITTKEIAEICGVSKGTVDRAPNNKPGINEQIKAKIIETAEKYGYSYNFIGRSLVTSKTRSIGAVVFNLKTSISVRCWMQSKTVRARRDML